jgi:serine/threonine protein kinase
LNASFVEGIHGVRSIGSDCCILPPPDIRQEGGVATDDNDEDDLATQAQSLGRYELGDSLGPSTFGTLRRAKVLSGADAGRGVVMRVIDRAALDSEAVELLSAVGFSSMEIRDARLAAVLDVVVEEGAIGIVSEWVDGVRLGEVLALAAGKGTECTVPVALRIVSDLVEAVRVAGKHWNDVHPPAEDDEERQLRAAIHGGLVPDSVLIASYGETMLTDAGMSGAAMTIESLRETVEALSHRAPEQLNGIADERTDVFTIGVLLWELLAGRALFGPTAVQRTGGSIAPPPPRAGSPIQSVKRKLESGSIQRLDVLPRLKGKVSKGLADLVARATDREAKRRFVSLDDLRSALLGLSDDVASPDDVARYVKGGGSEPSPSRSTLDTVPPTSSRPTEPPEDDGSLTERTTKHPGPLEVPAPPDSIISLIPEPPSDPSLFPFTPKATALAMKGGPSTDDEIELTDADDADGDTAAPARGAGMATDAAVARPSTARAADRGSSASRTTWIAVAGVAVLGGVLAIVFGSGGKEDRPEDGPAPAVAPARPQTPRPVQQPDRAPTAPQEPAPEVASRDAGVPDRDTEVQAAAPSEQPAPAAAPVPAPASSARPKSVAPREPAGPAPRTAPKPKAKVFRPDDI